MDFSRKKLTTYKSNQMTNETLAIAEKILYTIGIVTGFWKFTDTFFAYLHKRQKGFLDELIEEKLKLELHSLKEDIAEMKRQREQDNKTQFEQYRQILNELKK